MSMHKVTSKSNSNPSVLFWLAYPILFGIATLLIVGLWHRDNNYGVLPSDYSLRIIDSMEYAKLSLDRAEIERWELIPNSDKYVQITIKNPFVFKNVLHGALPGILFSVVALISYLWCHGMPRRSVPVTTAPKIPVGEPIVG